MTNLNLITLMLQADLVVQVVAGVLLLVALWSWVLVVRLMKKINGIKKFDEEFEVWLWGGTSLHEQYKIIDNDPERVGLEQVFYIGYDEFLTAQKLGAYHSHVMEATQRKFRVILGKQQGILEQGISTLASIGTISPYVGLFGMAYVVVATFGGGVEPTFDGIAPKVAQAGMMVALGLFVAIPATLFAKHFSNKTQVLYKTRELFCEELLGVFAHQNILSHKAP